MHTENDLDTIMANLDFSQSASVSEVPALAKLQARRKAEQAQNEISLIEPDVWQLIRQNANQPAQIAKVNSILRLVLS